MVSAKTSSRLWLFLIGLGSMTQVHFLGSIGISEIFMYVLAPFIFMLDLQQLKSDGFMGFLGLVFFVCGGCVISSIANHTPFIFFLKGFAFPYSIFAISVVFHRLLRRDLAALKWLIIGGFLSNIVCVFVFQPETYLVGGGQLAEGDEAVEMMINHPQFWAKRISAVLTLPISCWYMEVPYLYSCIIPLVTAVIQILMSNSSGRAGAIVALVGVCLIVMGGKSRVKIARVGRQLFSLAVLGVAVLAIFKVVYSHTAKAGLLGEEAQKKYFRQTAEGSSALRLLMAGRKEAFIGLTAAFDKPILGHGPKAEDTGGYVNSFLAKYGSQEDYMMYLASLRADAKRGYAYRTIPAHSHVVGFWLFYGLPGLIYWLYVYGLMFFYFRKYARGIPQWYGLLSLSCAGLLWSILFNPYGFRVSEVIPIVCILFARAVYKGRIRLPQEMEIEVLKYGK